MNLDSRFFDVQRHGAVAHLRMARPDKANSMNADFWHDLPRLLLELEADNSVRAAKAGKPAKVAIVPLMCKLLETANALIKVDRAWTPKSA